MKILGSKVTEKDRAVPAKIDPNLVRYDGSPIGTHGVGRLLQTAPAPYAMVGLFFSAAQEISQRGVTQGLINSTLTAIGLWGLNKLYDRLDRPAGLDENSITIDKSGTRPNNWAAAQQLHKTGLRIHTRHLLIFAATTAIGIKTGNSQMIATAAHSFGRLKWASDRTSRPGGSSDRSGLERALPQWTVQVKPRQPPSPP